ncbi:MAG: methylmalonyl-CoA mutase family protein, partial [Candidatus Caldarchaeum sp.]
RAEEEILKEIDLIWRMGGLTKAIEMGWLHRKIAEFSYTDYKQIQEKIIKIVGVNYYESEKEDHQIDVFRYPEKAEERQRIKLEKIRSERDNELVADKIEKIKEAAKDGKNLFPYVVEAVRERATEGELFEAFKQVYGLWTPLVRI